jgi:hypothetical protein
MQPQFLLVVCQLQLMKKSRVALIRSFLILFCVMRHNLGNIKSKLRGHGHILSGNCGLDGPLLDKNQKSLDERQAQIKFRFLRVKNRFDQQKAESSLHRADQISRL